MTFLTCIPNTEMYFFHHIQLNSHIFEDLHLHMCDLNGTSERGLMAVAEEMEISDISDAIKRDMCEDQFDGKAKPCGYTDCTLFLFNLSKGKVDIDKCPHIGRPENQAVKEYVRSFQPDLELQEGGLFIDHTKCSGCGICVSQCSGNVLAARKSPESKKIGHLNIIPSQTPVLRIENGQITMHDVNECFRVKNKSDCRVCVKNCPNKVFRIVQSD